MEHAANPGAPSKASRIAFAAAAVAIGLALLAAACASPAVASTGPAWSIVASPNTSATQTDVLSAVSCTSPVACVAVGHVTTGMIDQTLIETRNGTAWSITPSPDTSAAQNNSLLAVSCTSPTACVAVGFSTTGTVVRTFYQALIETWNGTAWSLTTGPSTPDGQSTFLSGVSCTSPVACVAVGDINNTHGDFTLIETWNGGAWSMAPSPNASTTSNLLTAVSCASPKSCEAVGYFFNGTTYQTLVETRKGTAWSIAPSPDTSTLHTNYLLAVSCTSMADCVAVGSSNNGTSDHTFIETWNGTAWSITPSPDTSTAQSNYLYGVSCVSSTACVAAGYVYSGANQLTLFESWNGTAWSTTPSPNASATKDNELSGLSCTSPTACVAVGNFNSGTDDQTLVESNPLCITTTWLPGGSVWSRAHRTAYSATLAATRGNPPYRWSLDPGSQPLPPGLKLKAAGLISGKATTAGTYSFTVQVVDTRSPKSQGHPSTQKATRVLSITIS